MQITPEQLREFEFAINRGRLAASFVETDFFRHYLVPHFNDSVIKIALENLDFPELSFEKIAIRAAANRGKKDFITGFSNEIRNWITEGIQASEKLRRMEETSG